MVGDYIAYWHEYLCITVSHKYRMPAVSVCPKERDWSWRRVVKTKQNGGQFDSVRQHIVLPLSYTATIFLILCPCSLKKWKRV